MKHRSSLFILLVVIATTLALIVGMTSAQEISLPGASTARISASGSGAAAGNAGRGTDAINDGSFELGSPNAEWAETSTTFPNVICSTAVCGAGAGTVGPRTGTFWVWLGGAGGGSANETGTVTQSLTLTSGTTPTLRFYLWIGSFDAAGTDSITVDLGTDEIFSAIETDTDYHAGYTQVCIDLTTYADDTARNLVFTGTDLAGANTNISVDDVSVVGLPCGVEPTPAPTNTSEPATETPTDAVTSTPEAPTSTPTDAATATPTEEPGVELLVNGGFEALDANNKPDITPWVVKNGIGDKAKCNKDKDGDGTIDKIVANTGNCAFRFKGGAGENSKLQQNVDLTGLTPAVGDALNFSAWVNAGDTPALKAKVRVKYSDGTEKGKINVDVVAGSAYVEITGSTTLASTAIDKISVAFKNKATSGKSLVDDVSLKWLAAVVPTATVDVTTEPTVDATVTAEPTVDATTEPTVEPTVDLTATATPDPTVDLTPTATDTAAPLVPLP
jgi:hypothetical protein